MSYSFVVQFNFLHILELESCIVPSLIFLCDPFITEFER